MEYKGIAEALHTYLLTCPLLGDHPLGVDWLPDHSVAFSIDTTPASQIIQRYYSGSSLRQYEFVLRSVADYGADILQNLANSTLYEQLAPGSRNRPGNGTSPTWGRGAPYRALRHRAPAT